MRRVVSDAIASEAPGVAASTAARADAPAELRPYPPSWLQRLVELIERLPGPTWAAYVVISVVSVVIVHTQVWSTTALPVGQLDSANTYYGILPIALLWTAGYLEKVAGSAFDAFRPALSLGKADVERLRYELTVMPARPSLVVTLVAMALTLLSYSDPVAAGIAGIPLPFLAGRFLLESFNTAVLLLLIYQLLRQMRDVRRTLARSAVVDLFQPGPLYAFSKLTSRTGMAIVLLTVSSLLFVPIPATTTATFLVTWAPYFVIPPLIAGIAFLVPLYGMHGRLVAEKDRLEGAAEDRLKGLLAEINRDIDARDLGRADGLNKTLGSMLQQRDVLAKLPTWPWSTGTLRAFITALLLPIVLFLIQRALAQLVV
jgi:hypothetical protein